MVKNVPLCKEPNSVKEQIKSGLGGMIIMLHAGREEEFNMLYQRILKLADHIPENLKMPDQEALNNSDSPKDILISYYNEIHIDKRLDNIDGRYNKNSILNLIDNIISQFEDKK